MERARAARRRRSRFSVMSGKDSDFLHRPRKEKLGSSSLVYEEDGEMRGGGGSEDEDEQHYLRGGRSHRSKLNGKAFNECDAVGSAAVPRKLRSVIAKRNRETISSPLLKSKRLRHISTHLGEYGAGHRTKEGSKLGTTDRPLKLLTPFLVTKDEEEVAEALFALASIIPADINPKRKGDQKVHVAESETRPGDESSLPLEAIKEECTILQNSVTAAEHSKITTSKEESPGLSVKLEPAIDSSFLKEQNLPASGPFQLDQEKVFFSPVNKSRKDEHKIESADLLNPIRPLCTSPIGNRFPPQTLMNVPDSLKGVNGIQPDDVQSKSNGQNSMDDVNVSNALPCKLQGGYGIETRSLMRANSRAFPVSLNCSADVLTGESGALKKKLHIGSLEVNQSWKRCATHLCIAELIQRHKGLGKDRFVLPIHPQEIKHNGGSVSSATKLNNEVPDRKSFLDYTNLGENCLATKRSSHVSMKSLFQDRKLLTDQFPLQKSGLSRHQNQGFNFHPLTTGGCLTKNIMEEHNPDNLVGYLKKLSSCSQSRQLHFDVMSAPQTRFSACHSDQIATATSQQVHLQQFLLNQYLGHVSKQQSMHQQQCVSQLGQYGSSNSLSHPLSALASLQSSVLDQFGVMFPGQHQLHTNVSSSPQVGMSFPQSGNVVDENGRVVLQQMLCNVHR